MENNMWINNIKLNNFRNYNNKEIKLHENINVFFGENAQGKTNLIEAIWMFTGARSFRGTKDADLVNFEKDSAKIKGDFFFENRNQEIAVFFDKSKLNGLKMAFGKQTPEQAVDEFMKNDAD